jgi:hypothetical protein
MEFDATNTEYLASDVHEMNSGVEMGRFSVRTYDLRNYSACFDYCWWLLSLQKKIVSECNFLSAIIRAIESRRMGCAGYVERMRAGKCIQNFGRKTRREETTRKT